MCTMRRIPCVVMAAASIMVALAACGGTETDKAGGRAPVEPAVLTFANNNSSQPAQLHALIAEVERRSNGSLRFTVTNNWRKGEPTQEQGTIEDVRSGKVDMAWVGARAFDSVGITSFQPLVAPLLVDSYDLQGAVFEAGIPGRMLKSIEALGLAGIGVLPGPMRKMMGVVRPFTKPSDFSGKIVGTSGGDLAEQTLQALGATPKRVPAQASLAGLDGLDYQLAAIDGNNYFESASHVTGNLNLWPRPLVIVMNADRFASLARAQQEILRTAAANAIQPALAASRAEDSASGPKLCGVGMTVDQASPSDLDAIRQAIEPVFTQLEQDPTSQRFLGEIRSLKQQTAVPAETFTCPPDGLTEKAGRTPIDGLYEVSFTREEYVAAGADAGELNEPDNWGSFTMRLNEGRFVGTNRSTGEKTTGTYEVAGDKLTMTFEGTTAGEVFGVKWSLYRDALTLSRDGVDWEWTGLIVKPWRRIG